MRVPLAPVSVARPRLAAVDGVRAVAILLMVLDHWLVQVDPFSPLRSGSLLSVTRLSLPLFMLASAAVWRPGAPLVRRYLRLFPVVCLELWLVDQLGMPQPGIVLIIALVWLLLDALAYLSGGEVDPYVLGLFGLVQALYVPIGWAGYEPGLVLAWFALGRLAWRTGFTAPKWCGSPALVAVGRFPLAWYVGHLAALFVLVEVL